MPFYITLALAAFLFSLLGTRLAILALRKRVQPIDLGALTGKKPPAIPSGGGIVVIFSLIICLLAADISYGLILSMLLLAAISMLHELIEVPQPVRLIVQVMALAIPLSVMKAGLFGGIAPLQADRILTGFLWIWFMNSLSISEKTNGPTSIETISIATGLCLIAVFAGAFPSALSVYSLILGASVTGFLWWNWPPAKIRMGDSGAIPIGFLLGYLLLTAANNGYHYVAAVAPAYLIAETVVTYLIRTFSANKNAPYYYQRARQNGFSEASIARYIIGVNILLVFLAARCVIDPELAIFYLGTAYLAVFMLMGFFAHNTGNESGK